MKVIRGYQASCAHNFISTSWSIYLLVDYQSPPSEANRPFTHLFCLVFCQPFIVLLSIFFLQLYYMYSSHYDCCVSIWYCRKSYYQKLYHSEQFQWWKKPEYPERTTDHSQATGNLYHLLYCESSALFFAMYKAGREPTPYW